jgi:hypothetical protein
MSFADCQFVLGVLAITLMPLVFLLPKRRAGAGGGPPVNLSIE